MLLSLAVVLDVFWILRQPGLTQAGDAACGILEHTHNEACFEQVLVCELPEEEEHIHEETCYLWEVICDCEEHIHSIECYSDKTADAETPLDWQEMFEDYPYTGNLRQDLVGIAETQVGYSESTLNFEVDRDGIRRGYTRYGDWYGTPYSDWSAMFVSFCLHYAGADPEDNPGNTGADSMAVLWDSLGRYFPAGEYLPVEGDLVFFADNTAGIVTMVHNATFYVIRGDVDDTVSGTVMSLDDPSIEGWGLTEITVLIEEEVYEEPEPEIPEDILEIEELMEETETEIPEDFVVEEFWEIAEPEILPEILESEEGNISSSEIGEEELLDISDGPAFFIFADGDTEPPIQPFSFRSARTVTDLVSYLNTMDGSYSFVLLDTNNQELPKDTNGRYIVTAGTSYKLTLTVNSPNGLHPGSYQYQLPAGLQVNGGNGSFILQDGTNVGTWAVSDNGLITMDFNENINNRIKIIISATMGIVFLEQDEPLSFDGKITVTVQQPPQGDVTTKLEKWGGQGNLEKGENPSKIYWTTLITGKQNSSIPGSIVTDDLQTGKWLGEHFYTDEDIAAGLYVGVSDPQEGWHEWRVFSGDPNLTWTEKGWAYTIPEICPHCSGVSLGNDGWTYYIKYTSTPERTGVTGALGYMNRVIVDGQQTEGWVNFKHGETHAEINKTGVFLGNAEGGSFSWELQAVIPGMKAGQKTDYYWYFMDEMGVVDGNGNIIGRVENDVNLSRITATHNGETFTVPNVRSAGDEDPFAWTNEWSKEESVGENTVAYGREIELLCRCNCTKENCPVWGRWGDESCAGRYGYWEGPYEKLTDFCHCWAVEGETTFTFTYETDDLSVIEKYSGNGNKLRNMAILYNKPDQNPNSFTEIDTSVADVPIPGVFKKELTQDFNGYTAHYQITVNEAKLVLTNGSPLTIHDVMTKTLAFISGSLVITAEDANGQITTLKQGADYTVEYNGTGDEHILDIVILHPQPVMYILDYDATLIIPSDPTDGGVKYSNSATITLWGEELTDESVEKVFAEINISAETYRVSMHKTDNTGKPLAGATFGLFNAQGGQITWDVTDANGDLLFQTNVTAGIILREHELYYMQELQAPPGYQLDDRKYWFCFCNTNRDSCETCDNVMAGADAFRIPHEQIGRAEAVNEPLSYNLPETGGSGIDSFVQAGVVCILTPLVYKFIHRRRKERRGAG